MSALPPVSDVDLLGDCKRVVDFDAKVSNGALNLGVTQEKLDSPQITGAPVDQRRLCSTD